MLTEDGVASFLQLMDVQKYVKLKCVSVRTRIMGDMKDSFILLIFLCVRAEINIHVVVRY